MAIDTFINYKCLFLTGPYRSIFCLKKENIPIYFGRDEDRVGLAKKKAQQRRVEGLK